MTRSQNQNPRDNEGAEVVSDAPRTTELNQSHEIDGENEFKLTVRKLEMPVRPRGVLAE